MRKRTGSKVLILIMMLLGLLGGCYGAETVSAWASTVGKEATSAATGQAEQTDHTALYPYRVEKGQEIKYGYINEEGTMVIQPIYLDAREFSEGFAVVYNGEENQVIDQKGKVIFATSGSVQDFHDGMAAFSDPNNNYQQGYINTKGKIVLKAKYGYASEFGADHTAIVTMAQKYCRIDKKGKVIKSYQLDSKYSLYDTKDGGYLVFMDQKTFLKGVITLEGKVILKPAYDEITYLGNDLFGVKKALPELEKYLISIQPAAIFDKNGKRLTPYQYYDLSEFHEGYASATDDTKTYLIDQTGKKATDLPTVEGRGTLQVMGNVIQADIDYEMSYLKKDGTVLVSNEGITELSSGVSVHTKILRPSKYVSVRYPELVGMSDTKIQTAINQKLEKIFTEYRKKVHGDEVITATDKFTAQQRKDLLIINRTGYDYPIGAAHGMPWQSYNFINMKTGTSYQLKDLFLSNSDYINKLSKIVYQQMQKNTKNSGLMYYFTSKDRIDKNQHFYLKDDKLVIYFDSGAITAYAAGFPEFEIPFKDIMSMINTQGAFWRAFHS